MEDKVRATATKFAFKKWAEYNRHAGDFNYNYDNADYRLACLYDAPQPEMVELLGGDQTASDYYCGYNERQATDPCEFCHVALKQAGDQLCAGCRFWADQAETWQKALADNIYQLVRFGRQTYEQKTAEALQQRIDERDRRAEAELRRIARIAHSSHAKRIEVKTAEELEAEAEQHADDYDDWAQSYETTTDDLANGRF